jgi:hypothetical protein
MKATSIACHPEGIEHILTTMAENLTSAKWQGEACRRLAHIATDDVVACDAIFANGGIERILAAMAKHQKTEEVLFHALAALDFLANDSEKQAKIVKEGGVERVFAAMSATSRKKDSGLNRDVQTYASSVLIKIAFNVEPKYEEMVYLDAKAAILDGCKILQKHGKTCDLQLDPERTSKAHLKEHVMAAISARFASAKMPMSDNVKKTTAQRLTDVEKTTAQHPYKLSLDKTASDLKNDPATFFICCKCDNMIQKDAKNPSDCDAWGDPYCNRCSRYGGGREGIRG